MAQRLNNGLPFAEWPDTDKHEWRRAIEGVGMPVSRTVRRWSTATTYARLAAYRHWLGYLSSLAPDLLNLHPAQRVTVENVRDYVDHLRQNCRETTVHIELQRLYLTMRVIYPEQNWSWLNRVSRRIAATARPLQKPIIPTPDLYRHAFKLMNRSLESAQAAGFVTRKAAIRFRTGLLIATLVEVPMRRGTLADICVGAQIRRVGSNWKIATRERKTTKPVTVVLSERLSRAFDVYFGRFRNSFPGSEKHQGLWPDDNRPMPDRMIWRHIKAETQTAFGVAMSPHQFRTSAATFLSSEDPENARVAQDLLGHSSRQMTRKHYVASAEARVAGRKLAAVLHKLRKS